MSLIYLLQLLLELLILTGCTFGKRIRLRMYYHEQKIIFQAGLHHDASSF